MYILECCDSTDYTGNKKDLNRLTVLHHQGEGANYTSKRLPITLVYYEEFDGIDESFYREKPIQGWDK
ncbi:MAG TPA: hypothetical protein P5123_05110 [Spirochaetota bacterium]|nr:hypothetical protein [Spirochaetota bacterium]